MSDPHNIHLHCELVVLVVVRCAAQDVASAEIGLSGCPSTSVAVRVLDLLMNLMNVPR